MSRNVIIMADQFVWDLSKIRNTSRKANDIKSARFKSNPFPIYYNTVNTLLTSRAMDQSGFSCGYLEEEYVAHRVARGSQCIYARKRLYVFGTFIMLPMMLMIIVYLVVFSLLH